MFLIDWKKRTHFHKSFSPKLVINYQKILIITIISKYFKQIITQFIEFIKFLINVINRK